MANDNNANKKTVAISEESWILLNELQSLILKKTGEKIPLNLLVQEGISMYFKLEMGYIETRNKKWKEEVDLE